MRLAAFALALCGCSIVVTRLEVNPETKVQSCSAAAASLWQSEITVDWLPDPNAIQGSQITIGLLAVPQKDSAPEHAHCLHQISVPPSESAWKIMFQLGTVIWGWVTGEVNEERQPPV